MIEAALVPPVCENLGTVNRRRVGEDFSVSCRYSLSDIEENYNLQFYKVCNTSHHKVKKHFINDLAFLFSE